jgi:hypothetical protein
MGTLLAEPPGRSRFTTGAGNTRIVPSFLAGRGVQLLYLALSLTGLSILVSLYMWGGGPQVHIPYQAQVTGAIFAAICLTGLVAAVSPRSLCGHRHGSSAQSTGHHPDCGRFSGHVLWVGGKPRCAGCSGLALGAMISIIGSVSFFYVGLFRSLHWAVFWVGVVAVALGLIQHFIDLSSPHIHFLLNVSLVSGSFMVAASMSAAGASFFVEAYHLVLVIFWVATRIRVSQEEHSLVCRACGADCEQGYMTE